MKLKEANGWELWDGNHPAFMGCCIEGREICKCEYHLINRNTQALLSFDSYKEAADSFKEKTGQEPFSIKK